MPSLEQVLSVTCRAGDTALHIAARQANVECITVLFQAGASSLKRNYACETPYDVIAVSFFSSCLTLIECSTLPPSACVLGTPCSLFNIFRLFVFFFFSMITRTVCSRIRYQGTAAIRNKASRKVPRAIFCPISIAPYSISIARGLPRPQTTLGR